MSETNLLVIKSPTFDSYNSNKDIRTNIYILIYHWNLKKNTTVIQSCFHLSQIQIKKVSPLHGLEPEPVYSVVQCSTIIPGKPKAVSDILGYILAYSLNLTN